MALKLKILSDTTMTSLLIKYIAHSSEKSVTISFRDDVEPSNLKENKVPDIALQPHWSLQSQMQPQHPVKYK